MPTTITGGTWNYSGDPAASDLDAARWLMGDTNEDDQLASDEELLYALSQEGSPKAAAASALRVLAARYAREPQSKKVGDLSISYGQRAADLEARASRLEADEEGVAGVRAGGISVADKLAERDDTDRTEPAFGRGMDDYPGTAERGSGFWLTDDDRDGLTGGL